MQRLPAVLYQDDGLLPCGDRMVCKGGGCPAFQHALDVVVAVGPLAPDGHEHGPGLGLAAVGDKAGDSRVLVPAEERSSGGL